MTPPELAGDTPGLDVAHPVEVVVGKVLRHKLGRAVLNRLDRWLSQLLCVGVPLIGEPRLDDRTGTVAVRNHVWVVVDFLDQTQRLEIGHNLLARLKAIHALISRRNRVVQRTIGVQDVDHFQIVALADFKVIEVVRRGDLDRTRARLRVSIVVANDRDHTTDERQFDVLANQILITLIRRINRNTRIAQHGLRPRGGHNDKAAGFARDGIAEVPEIAVDFLLLDFEVGNRGLELGVPVHQALVFVDQAFAVELHKALLHRLAQTFVHGEALTRPVRGSAEVAQLLGDRVAALFAPFPGAAQELFTTHVLLGQAFGIELAVDDRLNSDARVVGARLVQHVVLPHAVVAHQDVLQRKGQAVAHVQRARHVGRRHHDGIGFLVRSRVTGKGARTFPRIAVLGFGSSRIEGFVEHRLQS